MTVTTKFKNRYSLKVTSLILFLCVWQIASIWIEVDLLPSPTRVASSIHEHLFSGDLLSSVAITLARVGVSFFIAMAFGIAVGVLMGRNRNWDAALDCLLILSLNLPALVVIILCYLWFGLGEFAAVLAVSINKFPIVVVNMREGAKAVDMDLLQVTQAFKVSPYRTFFKVYLPQLYPYLLASARSGLALVWKIVLVVELLGRSDGVGFKLGIFFQFFDITSILAYSFAFILVVMIIELLVIAPLDRRLMEWR